MKTISSTPYDNLIAQFFGDDWKKSKKQDLDGAMGIAIVHSILDGIPARADQISAHIGVERYLIQRPFDRLAANNVFSSGYIESDRDRLQANDPLVWGYYAGYASGDTGAASY